MPVGRVALINKSLSKYFLQFLFIKIVIPAQAGIGTLNRAQRSRDKKRNEQLNINYKTRHSREGGNPLRRRHFYALPAGQ